MSADFDVLLIEDEEASAELFLMACEESGSRLRIEVASDGVRALERLHAPNAPMPRLVLLDLNMPRLSGFEVLARLRANPATACLRVVVFTASDRAGDRAEALRLGADDVQAKPMRFADLCQLVQRLEEQWLPATGSACA